MPGALDDEQHVRSDDRAQTVLHFPDRSERVARSLDKQRGGAKLGEMGRP
jgi:hypothetical protein